MSWTAGLSRLLPSLYALGIPVLAGLAYLAAFEAPSQYLSVNAAALVLAGLWIVFGRGPASAPGRYVVLLVLLALLFLPLITGPTVNGIARWLPLGPFLLHSGALVLPALTAIAAQDEGLAPSILLAALLAAILQPDAALGCAVTFAAAGLFCVTKNWRYSILCLIGLPASFLMALRGELPAQPFVEGILRSGIEEMPLIASALFLTLVAAFVLMLRLISTDRRVNYAMAGSLLGFVTMSVLSNYPSVLIGYGAAPILGYGLALGLNKRT